MSNPCITEHAPHLKDRFDELVKSGMSEREAGRKAAMEDFSKLDKELNAFKKSIGIKLSKEQEAGYKEPDNTAKIKEITDTYNAKIEEAKKVANEEAKATENIKQTEGDVLTESKVDEVVPTTAEGKEGKKPPIEPTEPIGGGKEELTGVTHAETDAVAKELGLETYETKPETVAEWDAQADKLLKEDPKTISKLLTKLNNNDMPSPVEQRVMAKYMASLKAKINKNPTNELLTEYKKAKDLSDIVGGRDVAKSLAARKQLVPIEDNLADFMVREMETTKVSELTEGQKETVQKEFTEISTAEKTYQQRVEALEAENAKLRAGRKVSETKSTTPKTRKVHEDFVTERKKITESISEKLKKARQDTNVVIVPYAKELVAIAPDVAKLMKSYVEEGVLKLEDITKKIHDELKGYIPDLKEKDVHDIIAGVYNEKKQTKNQIAEQIENIRIEAKLINQLEALMRGEEPKNENTKIKRNAAIEKLREEIKRISPKRDVSDATKLKALKTQMVKEAESLKQQIATGDFEKPEKVQPIKLDKEALELRDKLIKLRQNREVRMLLASRINEKPKERNMRIAAEVLNIPRTLMTIGDFSGLLRQDIFFAAGHPLRTLAATKEMFKAGWSQTHYDRWFADLKEDPRYDTMQKSRLSISDSLNHDLTKREEDFMSSLSEKIPFIGKSVVKGSERSYTALLNKSRVDMFNYFANSMEQRGLTFENSPKQYKAMAEYINNATGRSDFGETLNRVAPILNSVFFSPRLIASRVNMLSYWAQPRFWKTLPKEVKIDYFRNWLSLLAVGGTLMAVAKAGGAEVEDDPRSSDFGKIKSGNTRWDIWGGAQPYARVMAQVVSGSRKSTKSGKIYELNGDDIFGETRAGVITDFFRNKLAPVPGAAVDILSGRTGIGDKIVYQWGGAGDKEISLDQYVKQRVLPMTITGTQEAMKDAGVKALFTVGIPSTFGVGTQTYENKSTTGKKPKQKKPKKQPKKQ